MTKKRKMIKSTKAVLAFLILPLALLSATATLNAEPVETPTLIDVPGGTATNDVPVGTAAYDAPVETATLIGAPVIYVRRYSGEVNGTGQYNGEDGADGVLVVTPSTGDSYLLNYPYLISDSDLSCPGIIDVYLSCFPFNPELVSAEIFYQPDGTGATYLTLQTQFTVCSETRNQENIATVFDDLVDPAPDLQEILHLLADLPSCSDLNYTFDLMSGEQYSNQLILAGLANTRFIRRLYDPLRPIITCTETCEACSECCECCDEIKPEFWVEGGYTQTHMRNTPRGHGFNSDGYEIAGGAQCRFASEWTAGAAAGYYQDRIDYKLPGHSRMSTVVGGAYALYRPKCYYILGDLTFGYTRDKMLRKIFLSGLEYHAHGHSNIYQGTFYTEAGMDFLYNFLLVQPFAGIELGYGYRNSFSEHGADPLNLSLHKKNVFKSYSRLGVHLSTALCIMQLNADFAWIYRLSDSWHSCKEHFTSGGKSFKIFGTPQQRSGFEGILNLRAPLNEYFSLYADLSGEVWPKATTWSALGGIQANW